MTDTNGTTIGHGARRVLAVASGGGHWVQLLRLRPALAGEHVAWVTVNRDCRDDVGTAPFYAVTDATRWSRPALLRLTVQMLRILWRERPDIVISTGAAPGFLALRLARFFGARTIWLDSIANAEQLSLSGRRVGRYADLWLTQWPELAREGGPVYAGAVL